MKFPGSQRIYDWTSAGTEASKSFPVNSDKDLEYLIFANNTNTVQPFRILLNNDSGTNYGFQHGINTAGTISSSTSSYAALAEIGALENAWIRVMCPVGFQKAAFMERAGYSSGSTLSRHVTIAHNWGSTVEVKSLDFVSNSGNFVAGTRFIIFARRSQT